MSDVETAVAAGQEKGSPLYRIAREFGRLVQSEATGELAALRRMAVGDLPPPAFHRIMARAGFSWMGPDAVRKWARAVQIMAQRPDALEPGDLGAALAAIRATPQRVDVLLSARGPTLHDLARRTAYRLARSEGALPYRELCELVLSTEDDAQSDKLRIGVAQSYERDRPDRDTA